LSEPFWAAEYDEFVWQVSFAPPGETISFAGALAASRRLIARIGQNE
jgi:hypothetical protein